MVDKSEIIRIIEQIAPPETAESWDLCGWLIETSRQQISKVMLCLTVTDEVIRQAKDQNCDLIISHHPLFTIPFEYHAGIDIYNAHTNLDKASGGTTDTVIKKLNMSEYTITCPHEFLRLCEYTISFPDLLARLKTISGNIRYTNPQNLEKISKIAFCAGSGTDFWHDAHNLGAEILITGDLKFHTALDSRIAIIDIGHFESEVLVLEELAGNLREKINVIIAQETNPIIQIKS